MNPKNMQQAEIQMSDIQTAARSVGQQITVLNASTIRDIEAAFATLAQMRADALLVATDPFFFTRAAILWCWRLAIRSPRCTLDVSSPPPAG